MMAPDSIEFVQINLQHCRAASSLLASKLSGNIVALVQEPYWAKGCIQGLPSNGYAVFCATTLDRPRACIALPPKDGRFYTAGAIHNA